eukprot:gene26560-32098_t
MAVLGFGSEFENTLREVQDQSVIPIAKVKDVLSKMNSDGEKHNAMQHLCELRDKAIHAHTSEEYFNVFVSTWDFMASTTNLPFILFPRFPSPTTKFLRTLTNPVFIMKRYYEKKNTAVIGSGCCRLFAGPKGIGKTTLLSTFYVLVSVLTTHVLPIYWSYDRKGGNMEDPVHWPSVLTLCSPDRLLGPVNESKMILFLGDEVQEVYYKYRSLELYLSSTNAQVVSAANKLRAQLKTVIADLAAVGKSPCNLCFITGSSSNTYELCVYPETFGFHEFQTLNDSVFTVLDIQPVRQKEEFSKLAVIALSKLPDSADAILTEDLLCWLFNFSGGVGRALEALVNQGFSGDAELLPLPELFHSDLALQAIVNEMLFNVLEEAKSRCFNGWLHPHRLQLARVHEILKQYYNVESIGVKLSLYRDQSILYVYDTWVELMYPWHLFHFLNSQVAGVFRNKYEQMAFEGTLSGWSMNSSQRLNASAGHAVERPLLSQIVSRGYFQHWDKAGGLCEFNPDDPVISTTQTLVMKNIDRKLLQGPLNFLSLDGFVFVNTRKAILLYVCQIKSGRLNISADRADLCIWINKALEGIKKLIGMLNFTARMTKTIVVQEFLLLTTKRVSVEDVFWLLEADRMIYNKKSVPITFVPQQLVLNDIEDLAMRARLQAWTKGNN